MLSLLNQRFIVAAGALAALVFRAEAAQICGTKGYDRTRTYSETDSAAAASLAACGPICLRDPLCLSFAFGNSQCLLYKVAADGNIDTDTTSPFAFYDRSCPGFSPATSAPQPQPPISSRSSTLQTSTVSTIGITTGWTTRPPTSVPTSITLPPTTQPTTARTTTTSSTSTTLPNAPVPTGPECGLGGYSLATTIFFDQSGNYGNQTACAAQCKKLNCGSYGVGVQTCMVFNGPVSSSISFSGTSPYNFWDAACPIGSSIVRRLRF